MFHASSAWSTPRSKNRRLRMSDSTRYTYGTCSWVDASSRSAQYQRDPAIEEDPSDSPSRAPVTSTPTWRILVEKRARRLALVRMGMQGCVPSENRNRLSSSHWCNGRATFVHAEQEANRSSRPRRHTPLRRCPLERSCGQVTAMSRYTGTGAAPRAGIASGHPARARKPTSDSLGLRIGRMHASSTCRRLRWLVKRPSDGRSGEAW
jgi:hypothetical protein